jgi:immunity protein 22 of polymorphic toxin system
MDCRRPGFVSLWTGAFPSVEAAEAYFGIPDEIGVYLPPDAFANDLGLEVLAPESLEVNFEQILPRPLRELLKDATHGGSFIAEALEAAHRQGMDSAQGIALLYDFDYQAKPDWQREVGPLRFIGSFLFVETSKSGSQEALRDPRIEIRDITDTVL